MARLTDDQKRVIFNEIREHILIEGPRNWDTLMSKYPDVSRATFWRMVRETRERMEGNVPDTPGAMRDLQHRIRARVQPADQVTEKIKAHLPVAPSPAVVAAAPQDAMRAFNFFAFFDRLVKDAEMLRNHSVTVGEDGVEKLRNPRVMERSIARRDGLLQTYLQSVQVVYNVERVRELYDLIIDEVAKETPEMQQRVLARLRALNNKRGLTMAANP